MKHIWFILIFVLVGCKSQDNESRNFFVHNVYGEPIRQGNLPVVFYFDKDVPSERYAEFYQSAKKINEEFGLEVIRIAGKSSSNADFSQTSFKDGKNIIYWGQPGNVMEKNSSEQARTSVYWRGYEILETDIRFSPTVHKDFKNIDFDSLVRHEFYHVLGFKHRDKDSSYVLNTYLPENTVKGGVDKESLVVFYKVYGIKSFGETALASSGEISK